MNSTSTGLLDNMCSWGHEQVTYFTDPDSGYRAIIAIHNTALGPALGGTRLWMYESEADAIEDVLRLARGMTYKAALAGVEVGGGKAIILAGDQPIDRAALFRAHGRSVERLGGRYLTSVDIGSSPADMEFVREETAHVLGLFDRSGDPSPSTARGVLRAMQATLRHLTGSDHLAGVRVAIQGCGHVGASLARQLHAEGASLVLSDVDQERAVVLAKELDADLSDPANVHLEPVDIFSPCARGAVLNHSIIPTLGARMVVGAANNQLLAPEHDQLLRACGILYAPDYAANAGGLIHLTREFAGATPDEAAARVEAIYETIARVLCHADQNGTGTQAAADRIAEEVLASAAQQRNTLSSAHSL